MMKEGQSLSEQIDLKPLILLSGIFLLSQFAFSKSIRKLIHIRDNETCQLCGAVGGCECGHITHDKTDPKYNLPSNGRLLCLPDHLKDHINRAGRNGLTKEGNDWAIDKLKKRIEEKNDNT